MTDTNGATASPASAPTFTSRLPLNLLSLTVLVSAVWTFYGAIRGFYFEGAFLNAIAYTSDERPTAEGYSQLLGVQPSQLLVGIHAFFDFLNPYYWGTLANPWLDNATNFPVNYPPLAMLFMKFWALFDYRQSVALYIPAMAICLAVPVWLGLRRQRWSLQVLGVAVLMLSGPAVAALDRGNTQGFMPILFFGFGWAVLRSRWGWAAFFVVLATSMKLFPIILLLVLLAERRWKASLAALAGIGVINTLGFLLFPGSPVDSFTFWFQRASEFLGRDFAGFLEYNVSLAGGLAHWAVLLGLDGVAVFIAEHASLVILPALVAVVPLLWMRAALPLVLRVVVALMLTTVVLPVAYPYALTWAIAAVALVFLCSATPSETTRSSIPSERAAAVQEWAVVLTLPLVLAFYPVFIPGTMEAGYRAGLASLAAPVAIIGLTAALWVSVRMSRSPEQPARQQESVPA